MQVLKYWLLNTIFSFCKHYF